MSCAHGIVIREEMAQDRAPKLIGLRVGVSAPADFDQVLPELLLGVSRPFPSPRLTASIS